MRQRCNDSKCNVFSDYGGRGISVCKEWDVYAKFLKDMGRRPSADHSIDRIENDGNYEPGNCRWATKKEQARNRRSTVRMELNGAVRNIPDLAEEYGVKCKLIHERLSYGWSLSDSISRPVPKRKTLRFNNETKTITEWAKTYGTKYNVILYRINAGWSIKDAITTTTSSIKPTNTKMMCDGKTKYITEWVEIYGTSYQNIHSRSARGWSDEDAIKTPAGEKRLSHQASDPDEGND